MRRVDDVDLASASRPPALSQPPAPTSLPGSGADIRLDVLVERAIAEQVAEQRMIREALVDFDERLDAAHREWERRLVELERSLADRVSSLEGDLGERTASLERSLADRVSSLEATLERGSDRLAAVEARLSEGMEYQERIARAYREVIELAVGERLAACEAALRQVATELGSVEERLSQRIEALVGALDEVAAAQVVEAAEAAEHAPARAKPRRTPRSGAATGGRVRPLRVRPPSG